MGNVSSEAWLVLNGFPPFTLRTLYGYLSLQLLYYSQICLNCSLDYKLLDSKSPVVFIVLFL